MQTTPGRDRQVSALEQEVKLRLAQGVSAKVIALALQISEARVEQLLLGDHVVRVVFQTWGGSPIHSFLEALATAGICEIRRKDKDSMCFDLFCNRQDLESQRWATNLAKALEVRGFNAVCAPRWRDA